MNKRIKVAVAGVGSCASALIQGVEYYSRNPNETVGLMYPDIGGYRLSDIEFVIGFDIDARKVGRSLREAIYSPPNCNMRVIPEDDFISVISPEATVFKGPVLDGIAPHMRNLDQSITFVEDLSQPELTTEEFQQLLETHQIDILLNYMPVGAEEASAWYIENAIAAGVHIINCMPTYISTDDARRLELKAIERKITIVGSDMRSSYGASRLSEVLQGSLMDSGLEVTQQPSRARSTSSMVVPPTPTFLIWPRSHAFTISTSQKRTF
ncbi:MAG: hypothetical protein EBU88_02290 [Acidobacteria bacterium]|nr:hypothetical protein [Acidobacteriota bacterium]